MPETSSSPFTHTRVQRMVLLHRAIESDPIELSPFSVDAALSMLTEVVEKQVNELLRSSLENNVLPTEFKIRWLNQPDIDHNPFGDRGRFRTTLAGYKPEQ